MNQLLCTVDVSIQRFRQHCDTIISQAANPISESCVFMYHPFEIDQKLKDRLLGLREEISLIRTLSKYR